MSAIDPAVPRRAGRQPAATAGRPRGPGRSAPPGAISPAELRAVEDEAIAAAVAKVEAIGMRSVTDGEFRRAWFHLDFLEQLDGVAVTGNIAASSDAATTVHMTPPKLSVVGPLRHVRDIQVADFRYLASVTTQTPKVSIPSPTMVHFRGGRAAIDIDAYPDLEVFFDDLAACYRAELAALYAAGCRYVQLDDTNLAYLCDPVMRAGAVERGDDPDALPHAYAELINAAIADRPADLVVGHPPVPRQLPQHVVRRRAATSRSPRCCSPSSTSTPTSSSTTTSARATSPRCATSVRTRPSCSGWSPASGPSSSRSTLLARRVDEAARYVPARPAVPEPAVRLRQHGRGQRPHRGRAVGQARATSSRPRPASGPDVRRPCITSPAGSTR